MAKRKSLTDTVKPKSIPQPDLDLEGLEKISNSSLNQKQTEKPKRLSVDLDPDLMANYKVWCAKNRTTIKARTIKMIREMVNSN